MKKVLKVKEWLEDKQSLENFMKGWVRMAAKAAFQPLELTPIEPDMPLPKIEIVYPKSYFFETNITITSSGK